MCFLAFFRFGRNHLEQRGRETAALVLPRALSCLAQAVQIKLTWSPDIAMKWSIDIPGELMKFGRIEKHCQKYTDTLNLIGRSFVLYKY